MSKHNKLTITIDLDGDGSIPTRAFAALTELAAAMLQVPMAQVVILPSKAPAWTFAVKDGDKQ